MAAPRDCPCHSGLRYAACCGPAHRGERDAATPGALVRARYSAFALGLGDYVVRTLGSRHPDHGAAVAAVTRDVVRVREARRFLGVMLWHESETGDEGEVLFHARMFERGRDVSLVELSTFRREDGAWRYESGVAAPRGALPAKPLTRDAFLALVERLSSRPRS